LCYVVLCFDEGAGADFVMAGGMFASHYESGGEIVQINGKLFKQFYGNISQIYSFSCNDCIGM
jgi:IMP dehydrogenase/GMP reductase